MSGYKAAKREVAKACLILGFAVVATLFVLWNESPQRRFLDDLKQIRFNDTKGLTYRGQSSGEFSVNTYSDGVERKTFPASTETIVKMVNWACDRADALRGERPLTSYLWFDRQGWPRFSSVVQFPEGFLEIQALENNDNDMVRVLIRPGKFDTAHKREQPSRELPQNMLRVER